MRCFPRLSHRLACAALVAGMGLLSGCQTVATAADPRNLPADREVVSPSYTVWLAELRQEALAQGIRAATFDAAMAEAQIRDRVLELDQAQPEFTRPVWVYLDNAISGKRVREGQERLARHAALLQRTAASTGVPPEILVAFWGIETDYGRQTGGFAVLDALTTLAWKGRRAQMFRKELLAALKILDAGDVARERMTGSWAGAMGQTQFMPSVYLAHATDADQDHRRDIWGSLADVFASTAGYLVASGWRSGESWGEEVRLPPGFPWDQVEPTLSKPLSEWRRLGVRSVADAPLAEGPPAALLAPAGHAGPVFLVRDNFRVIMRYNPATSYALAVALLSDQMKGRNHGVVAPWPRHEPPLSRSTLIALQENLARLGYDAGSPDGVMGPTTRAALRQYQIQKAMIADGFPSRAVLEQIARDAGASL